RPYTKTLNNWDFPKFYEGKGMWVSVDPDLDDELQSFARCLRGSELVGLNCIEQYLPHRVAKQFGLDQDLPGYVARANDSANSREIAWSNYSRPISDVKLYIPSRLFEADVTWKQSALVLQTASNGILHS
ncbi:PMD domain-containing protein, partial [Cephalotus follicularis]